MKIKPTARFGDMKSAASAFKKRDVLYGRLRSYLNKVAVAEFDGAASAEFIVFTEGDQVDPYFLAFLLHSRRFVQFASSLGTGDRPRVDVEQIGAFEFFMPPLDQQRRIVARIEELFGEIEAGEQELAAAKADLARYRRAVLKAAVTGELTRDWREHNPPTETGANLLARILKERRARWEASERAKLAAKGQTPKNDAWKARYPEPVAPNTDGLPELPRGWVWASLPQLGEFGRGKSKHRPRNDPNLYGGPYPFIQTGDVRQSGGVIIEHSQTYSELGLAQSKLWPQGTVCITIAANIAASAILSFDACFPDSVVGLVPADPALGRYAEYFVRTARNDLDRYAPATAQKNINLDILEKVALPLPPYAELAQIERSVTILLEGADDIADAVAQHLQEANCLRQSILAAAFSGKLVAGAAPVSRRRAAG